MLDLPTPVEEADGIEFDILSSSGEFRIRNLFIQACVPTGDIVMCIIVRPLAFGGTVICRGFSVKNTNLLDGNVMVVHCDLGARRYSQL